MFNLGNRALLVVLFLLAYGLIYRFGELVVAATAAVRAATRRSLRARSGAAATTACRGATAVSRAIRELHGRGDGGEGSVSVGVNHNLTVLDLVHALGYDHAAEGGVTILTVEDRYDLQIGLTRGALGFLGLDPSRNGRVYLAESRDGLLLRLGLIGVGVAELDRIALTGLLVDLGVDVVMLASATAVKASDPVTINFTHNQSLSCPPMKQLRGSGTRGLGFYPAGG